MYIFVFSHLCCRVLCSVCVLANDQAPVQCVLATDLIDIGGHSVISNLHKKIVLQFHSALNKAVIFLFPIFNTLLVSGAAVCLRTSPLCHG